MRQSESIALLASALAKAQGTIAPALKESVNPHFRSHYADLAAIWEVCRKPLTSNGLSVIQAPTDCADGRVGLETRLIHSSGEWIESLVSTRLSKDDAQGIGSALTYLRRYSLASIVGVTATDDDDGNAASAPQAQAVATAKAYKPPVKAAEPRGAAARAQASEGILEETIIVESAKIVKGTTGAGKAYTRWVIEWLVDGVMCKGATFSATAGEMCVQAQKTRDQVYIEYTLGQYGKDIKTATLVDPMSKSERIAADETIPF